ncbi:MAG: ABC transporter permease [Clostridiales bacterium]|nr:ABC transporter permease [Clostridiales bacterium]
MKIKIIVTESIRMLLLLVGVSIFAFVLITKAPIDPLTAYVGTENTISQEHKEEISEYWGLNNPLPERFGKWAKNFVKGDMGESISFKKPVAKVIKERFSNSIVLMMVSWALGGILGFILGTICGRYENSIFDRILKTFCLGIKSTPTFWLGLIMLTVFSVILNWFPIGMSTPIGKLSSEVTLWDRIYHMILPTMALTIVGMSSIFLYTRHKFIDVKHSDFVLYAKTRGETESQISRRHILRNIALPAITLQFASFSELFGGMAMAENVFAYPGIGTATTKAALSGDIPLLLGISVISAIFVFSGNLIANILYVIFDPRMRGTKHHA